MNEDQLWAKSDPQLGLLDHLIDVRNAGEAAIYAVGSDLAEATPSVTDGLDRLLDVACWVHDLLKATTAFQRMIDRTGQVLQPIRHEALAAVLMVTDGPLRDWLMEVVPNEADRWAVIWAVAGHHLKMADPSRNPTVPLIRDYPEQFTALLRASEVKAALERAAPGVAVRDLHDLPFDTAEEDEPGCLRGRVAEYVRISVAAWRKLKRDPRTLARVALLKGLLIAADVGGSAAPANQISGVKWTRTALGLRLAPADLDEVIQKGTKGKEPHPFQEAVGASEKLVTLVAAGCGNGKTTAAYLWAQKHAAGKKLFFTYPTTGTATAGYASYLADQHTLLADLIHMRAGVDLEAIHGTPRVEPADESAVRIESLRVWDRKVVVCTVDTVLGLLQCQRRGMYSLPAFLAGAMVFDEVHSYDRRLFGGLLRFLKEFPGIPVLIMSASIPPGRLKRLTDVLGDRAGDVIKGDPELEGYERYRLDPRGSEEACWKDVEEALAAGKKVLWVCNTVGDAIQIAGQAKARDGVTRTGVTPIVYHSRFRYKDRVRRQEDVLKEFAYQADGELKGQRVKPGPSLVIATQVCEMSLDISADLLVTAECPLPALVQRLGRLNRYATGDDPWQCLVYPFQGLPYNEDPDPAGVDLYGDYRQAMTATRDAVKELAGKPCRQRNLAERLDLLEHDEEPETYSALFDDGWVTVPRQVRDGEQSVTVIRQADIEGEIPAALGTDRKKWTAGKLAPWTIPMNYRRGMAFDESAGPYSIAGDDILIYTTEEGGQWAKS